MRKIRELERQLRHVKEDLLQSMLHTQLRERKHYGYIIAKTNGGSNKLDNLQTMCQPCNHVTM